MSIGPSIPEIQHFQNLTLKIQGQGQMTMMLHNYKSRQFHRTWNVINLSSGFRDMGSASLAQVLPHLTSFWPRGKPIWGKWANTIMLHNYRSKQVHETLNGVNPSSSFRDMRSAKTGPKFLAHGQAHMGQMGIWPWQCTPTGPDNSTELRMEKIRQAVTEMWVPQVWQPPARPPAHLPTRPIPSPDRDDNTPPARRAEG